jgi:hypothetical protein
MQCFAVQRLRRNRHKTSLNLKHPSRKGFLIVSLHDNADRNPQCRVEITDIHVANVKLHVEILVLHVAKLKFHVKIVVLHMDFPQDHAA